MDWALALSAALMGLAGMPHCVAMCGPTCVALTAGGQSGPMWSFHIARVASYATAGAVVAAAVGTLASLGQAVSVLRPFWTLLHAAALGLGVWLVWYGRQPGWLERLGRSRTVSTTGPTRATWKPVQWAAQSGLAGLAWSAWPCGLLQSALLVASMANSALGGAAVMTSFAVASAGGLAAGSELWRRFVGPGKSAGAASRWIVRFSGLMLIGSASWALGHGVWMRVAAWCGLA